MNQVLLGAWLVSVGANNEFLCVDSTFVDIFFQMIFFAVPNLFFWKVKELTLNQIKPAFLRVSQFPKFCCSCTSSRHSE